MIDRNALADRRGRLSPDQQALLDRRIAQAASKTDPGRRIPSRSGSDPVPLSSAQERLWFLNQLEDRSSVYNRPANLRLRGPLDASALRRSLQEIVRRHDVLRSCFPMVGSRPVQRINGDFQIRLDGIDLRPSPDAVRESEARLQLNTENHRPFDLATGPLVRACLFRLADEEHWLALTFHHIVFDGWSESILWEELGALHKAFANGLPSPLPELGLCYADYAAWQRSCQMGPEARRDLAYWTQQLAGVPSSLDLATDFPRPRVTGFRGARHDLHLNGPLVEALRELGQSEGATLFMVLLATFQVFLSRHGGQQDVSVGTPIAGRSQPELEGLIGCFINTLVLRTDLSGDPTFRGLLQRVRDVTLGAFAHQEFPFERLIQGLNPARSPNRTPLFEAMLVLRNTPTRTLELPGLEVSRLPEEIRTSKLDLTLTLQPEGPGLVGALEYSTDLFQPATIARWVDSLHVLLAGIITDPGCRISRLPLLSSGGQHRITVDGNRTETGWTAGPSIGGLPLLTEAERRQVLVEWNQTETDYPKHRCLHELFEAQVKRTPESVAVECGNESVTYAGLNTRANRLAHHLIGLGVAPGQLVALCVERSIGMVVALLATLKAGGAYVPLDIAYPKERLAFMLADTRARVLITQRGLVAQLPAHRAEALCLEDLPAEGPGHDPVSGVRPHHLAYVIYTSGSTGQPKGVLLGHRGAVNLITSIRRDPGFGGQDVMLSVTTLAFDIATAEIFLPLCSGGRLVLASREVAADGTRLLALLQSCQATFLQPTPVTWRMLLEAGWQGSPQLKMISTGDPLPRELAARLLPMGAGLWNLYGPTETTIWSTGCRITDPALPISIGRPLANTRAYILDARLQPVAIGTTGELYLGGDGLARGYLNNPELTVEKFVPNPFATLDGSARLYRTGDLARWGPTGMIECLGRIDHQVKLRGFRIEPGEIETLLTQHPGVREAVVLLREDRPGDPRLAAYLVAAPAEAPPSTADLRRFLHASLPEYMVPSVFVFLDAFPITPNGKLDRKALPVPVAERSFPKGSTPPRTPTERVLEDIWAEVLGLDAIGLHENFFELGGHSLLAMGVIGRARNRLAIDLAVHTLFEAPTLAKLGARIDAARADPPAIPMPPLRPLPHDGCRPVSFAQERMWFLDQIAPDRPTYIISSAVRFRGPLNPAALERSLREVIRRHEALRTTLTLGDGGPQAGVLGPESFRLPVTDLRGLPGPARETEARRRAEEEAARPFNLSRDLMLRAQLLQLGDQDHVLVLATHHIASDGWSQGVFDQELSILYTAFSRDQPSPLPGLPIQYADYAGWQRGWLEGAVRDRQIAYWKGKLAGAPTLLELPTDHSRPPVAGHQGAQWEIVLDAKLTRALHALARREGVTTFMTLLAAWQVLLSRYSGQEDLSVGAAIAGRNRTELEGLIGFFVNTLVLRTDLSGNPTFRELLARVRRTTLEAYAHQDLPFEKLVEELRPERSLAHAPLFQAMFVLQNAPSPPLQLPGITVEPLAVGNATAKFDLTLSLGEQDGRLQGTLEYRTDLFGSATIGRLAAHFQTLLEGIVADAGQPIGALPMLSTAERRQILVEWNQTQTAYPREECLHGLFEAQVARTPDAVAVVCGDESVSYTGLNTRANQLAHTLRAHGIGPGSPVALHLDRSTDFIVSVLAVLKSGGCYVPLPVEFPAARLRHMLEDSRATLVITRVTLPQDLCPPSCSAFDLESPDLLTTPDPVDRPVLPGTAPATACQAARVEPRPTDSKCPPAGSILVGRGSARADPVASLETESEGAPADRAVATRADSLAYIMYTSGSTGRPKGVAVPHRAVCRLVHGQHYADFGPGLRTLLLAPLAFDASTFELWAPLLHGGTCVVFPGRQLDLEVLGTLVERQRINCLWLTAALFNEVIDLRPSLLAGVAQVLAGGEALSVPHVLRARQLLPHTRLTNGYGPTECTTFACTHPIGADEVFANGSVPIGRPLANTTAYVLDRNRQPVPVGVRGELYMGGDGLAHGYLHQPGLTARKFITDPFGSRPGGLLYKTGDQACWRSDGTLTFLGRMDQQVKIRGFRVEPAEVESTLATHPDVGSVAVVARPDSTGTTELAAALVPRPGSGLNPDSLRSFLKARLPGPMIPAVLELCERLPLTPSGKVDRAALRLSIGRQPVPPSQAAAPRTGPERRLLELWSEALGRTDLGIHDNFFECGGHSLLAIRLVTRIGQVLEIPFQIVDLFEHPTVAGLANHAERRRTGSEKGRHAAFRGTGTGAPLFHVPGRFGFEFLTPRLAECIGALRPYFDGLQFPGLDGRSEIPEDAGVIAEDLVRQIQEIWPAGPLCLSGHSWGGVLAYEVASRLVAAGRTVESVILLDSVVPGSARRRPLSGTLKVLWQSLQSLEPGTRRRFLWEISRNKARALLRKSLRRFASEDPGTPVPAGNPAQPVESSVLWDATEVAYAHFRPGPYDGDVVLFRATVPLPNEALRTEQRPLNGWGDLVRGRLTVFEVPSIHSGVFKEPIHPDVFPRLREVLAVDRGIHPKPTPTERP